jgi:hypothetical protein
MKSWSQNDDLFFKELNEGHRWQALPALFFRLQGFSVEMPELRVRSSIKEAGKWKDSADLIVQGQLLEVKSRNESFYSPESFPYPTILVDTESGYQAKETKPLAYIMISRPTGVMLALRATSPKGWMVERKRDRVRNIWDNFYLAERSSLQTLDCLVSFIRNQQKKNEASTS